MSPRDEICVGLTGTGAASCEQLIEAIQSEGWTAKIMEDLDECVAAASAGMCQMVLVACSQSAQLHREPIRELMTLRANMSLLFLIPDDWVARALPALAGTTSDQIFRISTPVPELMDTLRSEQQSVQLDRPRYMVVCADDDLEFLASMEAFLPRHLQAASPQFDLDFEFFDTPAEALDACKEFEEEELAMFISDQLMPGMNGIELLTRVKEMRPNTKRVLLTGHAGLDSAVTGINEGVLNKYALKPVEPVGFCEALRQLLSERHLNLRAETRQNRMMAQFEFVKAISAARTIEEALQNTVNFLDEQIPSTHAMIALMHEGQLVFRAANSGVPNLTIGDAIPIDRGIWGWLAKHNRPIGAARQSDLPEEARMSSPLPLLAAPLLRDKENLGAVLLSGRPAGHSMFSREEALLMNFVADTASVSFGSFRDRKAVEKTYVDTMASLMETVEAKDSYTRGHTERVSDLSLDLAKAVGVTGQSLQDIKWAAALHDIGKIALPDAILLKNGGLTDEEYTVVQDHPIRADRILQPLKYLNIARMIVRSHHESYDGCGYPDKLTGEEIPLGARILAIADSYDAMTSARPYRTAMDPMDALEEIKVNVGRQFDARLAATFLEMMYERLSKQQATEENGQLSGESSP